MSYLEKREKIDLLQKEINAFGELKPEIKNKINYKFRLDWNYYSNSIEGNTLTQAETRSVMIGNITVGGKPIKDVLEMKGHDEVITEILKIAMGELRISEKRVCEIHQSIMYEEDESKKNKIGKWKTENNYIINYKGEKFDFALPFEVPVKMHDLINKTNADIDSILKNKKSPIEAIDIALQFHLEFVSIHPFYDGNGRMARILTNLLLISFGYPPFWVKNSERDTYNRFLADIQGYGGKPDLFYEFIADKILRSQQLMLGAITGKNIEEEDDLDKEIFIFKQNLLLKESLQSVKKTNKLIAEQYIDSLKIVFDYLVEKHKKLDELFTVNFYNRRINDSYPSDVSENEDYIESQMKLLLNNSLTKSSYENREINNFCIGIHHKGFLKDKMNVFDANFNICIKFDDYQYHIGDWHKPMHSFPYNYQFNKNELITIASEIMKNHFKEIKDKIQS